jgi:predicted MPP superfamily phosphohydrolase
MRNSSFGFVLIVIMVLLDIYVFQAVKVVSQGASPKARLIVYSIYWILSILALLTFILLPYLQLEKYQGQIRSIVFAVLIGLFFAKLITALFLFIDDIRRLFQWASGKLFFPNTEGAELQSGEKISRSVFLNWIGIAAGGGLFGSLIYGFSNKYNYHVKRIPISFQNLPAAFKGLKIVQISDVHSGSFSNKEAVNQGIRKIMDLKPDLILFTGDLVNNTADEMKDYKDIFSQLKAPMGVYSILGNHDYGDYVQWESRNHRDQNLEQLKKTHAEMGWRLLMNEHVIFEREGEKIALLGIENWSAKARFPKYGKMQHAHTGTDGIPFKVLMSHDPSHWEAEVLESYKDIDLMLSGHTHGMQFGVEIPWLKWSPVQYVYKQWAGLYKNENQHLYVNRGFGFLGYPGRVGIMPEITLLELS